MKKYYYYIVLCIINAIIPIIDSYNKVRDNRAFLSSLQGKERYDNILFPIYSDFSVWICGINANRYSTLYFYVLLATTLIFGFIFTFKEEYSWIPPNMNRLKYCSKMYSMCFLLTGLLAVFPLLVNFIVLSMFVPSINPDSVYDIYFGIFSDNIFGDIFYRYPLLYLLLFIMIVFVFWGLIGCIEYGLSVVVKYKPIPLLLVGGVLLVINYIQHCFKSDKIFSPLSIFCSYRCLYDNYKMIIVYISILVILVMLLFVNTYKYKSHAVKQGNK